jgi:hypothetical protein
MNGDDIIRMAREAGFEVNFDIWAVSVDGVHINKELRRFAAIVAAAERNACAEVCDNYPETWGSYSSACHDCADAIRARGRGDK